MPDPHPILDAKEPDEAIYLRVGKVASAWSWIEGVMCEMLAFLCQAEPGAMYVLSKNVSNATVSDWLKVLVQMKAQDADTRKVILDLLGEIDDARNERNVVVYGLWRAHPNPTHAWVLTIRWERSEVARHELWSTGDLDDLLAQLRRLHLMLANLGIQFGFLRPLPLPESESGLSRST
jgi:hypothetical protein